MQINLEHTLHDLANDCANVATTTRPALTRVVKKNVEFGSRTTRSISKAAAGPHGANFYKRISGEMTGALEGEWGPSAVEGSGYVGVNYSGGGPDNDLEKSLDVVRPKVARDVDSVLDRAFW